MKKISLCQLRNNRYVLLICFLFSNICVFSQGKINVIEAYYIDEGYSYASNHIEIALCECCCPYLFITLQMNKYDIDSVMLRSYADFEKNKCSHSRCRRIGIEKCKSRTNSCRKCKR